jgi:hypothetical protein
MREAFRRDRHAGVEALDEHGAPIGPGNRVHVAHGATVGRDVVAGRRGEPVGRLEDAVLGRPGPDELLERRPRLVGIGDAPVAAERGIAGPVGIGRDLVPSAPRTKDVGHRQHVTGVRIEHHGTATAGVHVAHGLVEPAFDHVLNHQVDRQDEVLAVVAGLVLAFLDEERVAVHVAQVGEVPLRRRERTLVPEFHAGQPGLLATDLADEQRGGLALRVVPHQSRLESDPFEVELPHLLDLPGLQLLRQHDVPIVRAFAQRAEHRQRLEAGGRSKRRSQVPERIALGFAVRFQRLGLLGSLPSTFPDHRRVGVEPVAHAARREDASLAIDDASTRIEFGTRARA